MIDPEERSGPQRGLSTAIRTMRGSPGLNLGSFGRYLGSCPGSWTLLTRASGATGTLQRRPADRLFEVDLVEARDSEGFFAIRIPYFLERHQKERRVQVLVRDNNVDQALKALKKKMQREGIFREMKLRGHYEKPSEKKAREKAEAGRRARKLARKRAQREGGLPAPVATPRPARP